MTEHQQAVERVRVKQVDREAAAKLDPVFRCEIVNGGLDNTALVQAIARHREQALASLSPPPPTKADMVLREDAARKIADKAINGTLEAVAKIGMKLELKDDYRESIIAAAIRNPNVLPGVGE